MFIDTKRGFRQLQKKMAVFWVVAPWCLGVNLQTLIAIARVVEGAKAA
jgi:hypothetical protein